MNWCARPIVRVKSKLIKASVAVLPQMFYSLQFETSALYAVNLIFHFSNWTSVLILEHIRLFEAPHAAAAAAIYSCLRRDKK